MERENKIKGIVYKLTNTKNGKFYIGQMKNEYIETLKNNLSEIAKYERDLKRDIELYGEDSFNFEVLDKCEREDEMDIVQMYFICKSKSYDRTVGYNASSLTHEGKLALNVSMRNALREKYSGKLSSPNTKRKVSLRIIVIKDKSLYFVDSAALFAQCAGTRKDIIKTCLRQPTSFKGYHIFYYDKEKIREMYERQLNKQRNTKGDYKELAKYLLESSVETIEKDYDVHLITYENYEEYTDVF